MKLPEIELTKRCDWCANTGKKWIDKKTYHQIMGWQITSNDKKIKETDERCPYCLGTKLQPTDFGIEIIRFVKTYLGAKLEQL